MQYSIHRPLAASIFGMLALLWLGAVRAEDPWPRHTIDASSLGADGVRLEDVNGDGLMDIAVGWEEGGVVRAYLHPDRGSEKQLWPAVTVGKVKSAEDAVFVDLDQDGVADVVSSCEGKTRTMFAHWAPASEANYLDADAWRTEPIPCTQNQQMWMYALPRQIDGRRGIDLITGSKGENGSIGWLEAPVSPRVIDDWKWHKLEDAGWIMSLISIDMDRDGDLDLLVSDRKGARRGVYWLEYPGVSAVADAATWTRHDIGGSNREILFLSVGDVDQDGTDDIVAIDRESIVWYRADGETWDEFVVELPKGVGTGKSAVVNDVDGDGRHDLVFSCENAKGELSGMRWLSWKKSPTDSLWTSHEIGGPLGLKYDRIELLDVDDDGDQDVLCCEERDQLGVFWYENPYRSP